MIPSPSSSPDLAATLAGSIFDRIESDRTLIRGNIETVIRDGLLLDQAKAGRSYVVPIGGGDQQRVIEGAKSLIKALHNDSALAASMPRKALLIAEEIFFALANTGWAP